LNQSLIDVPIVPKTGRRHWLRPGRRRVVVLLLAAFAIWGWFDVRQRGTLDPNRRWMHKTDLTVYTEAGAAFFDGRDPYEVTNPRGWGYLYPPLFAILISPLHQLDTRNQVYLWFLLNVLMGWGCYREVVRIARTLLPGEPAAGIFGPIPTWIGVCGCTAAMLPALNCLQRGQVGVAKLYLLLLGFRVLVESRSAIGPWIAGLVLACPIALKITPVVPVAIALVQQLTSAWYVRARAAWVRAGALCVGTAGGLAICFFLLPGALVGWRANLDHLGTWWTQVALRAESAGAEDFAGDSTSVRNQSLVNATHRLGNWAHYYFAGGPFDDGPLQLRRGGPGLLMDAPLVRNVLIVVRVIAGVLIVAVGFRMAKAQDRLGQAAAFGLACAATLIIFPIARTHYYLLLLPAVTFVSLWFARQDRMKWAVALAIAPCILVIAHYVRVDVVGRVGLLGLGTTLWYLTAGVAMLGPFRPAVSQAGAFPRSVASARADERAVAA
jgi:Glycosyltransferase family 87